MQRAQGPLLGLENVCLGRGVGMSCAGCWRSRLEASCCRGVGESVVFGGNQDVKGREWQVGAPAEADHERFNALASATGTTWPSYRTKHKITTPCTAPAFLMSNESVLNYLQALGFELLLAHNHTSWTICPCRTIDICASDVIVQQYSET